MFPHWLTFLPDPSSGINFPASRRRERNAALQSFFPLTTVRTYNPSSYTKMTNLTGFMLNYGHCGKDIGFSPHWYNRIGDNCTQFSFCLSIGLWNCTQLCENATENALQRTERGGKGTIQVAPQILIL